ncbi:ATP-binding protein [Amycolatopsis sp. lyj-23]|uniref:ATP-binding protein n=1 Tax=Amycolatopsis sp. lyj-23 TaxID=2789283 RepID=UPI00397992BF
MGADPLRVQTRADLVRQLDLLRTDGARGSGRRKVSLAELSQRIKVPRSTLHTYLTGMTLPPADVLDRIVIALGGDADAQARWATAWDRVTASEQRRPRGPVTASAVVCPPRQLPADVPVFTGRDEQLAELDRLLAANSAGRTVVVTAIAGTAGVGKTALAVHWAHRVLDRFPDGQLHLDLRGYDLDAPVTAAEAAASLLRALGVAESGIPRSLDERASRLRSLLAGTKVLLLLDNASNAEQVRCLLPASPSCFTVITSRDTLSGLTIREGAQRLELDLLSMAESVTLLRHLLGERVDYEHDDAEELARLCGRLPLALRIAAERARVGAGAPLRELVGQLADEQHRLRLLDSGDDPRTTVRAVFSWSYRRLAPEAAKLFRLLGCHPGRSFDTRTAAALAGCAVAAAARTLDLLVRASLIRRLGDGRYDLHDLLRDYSRELARTAVRAETHAATERLFDHYTTTTAQAVALVYPAHRQDPGDAGWPRDESTARSWLDAELANLVAVVAAATGEFADRAVRLAAVAARHLDTTGRWRDATTMHTRARDAAEAIGDTAAYATALRDLGMAVEALGDHEQALACFRRSAGLRRDLGDRAGQAAALTSIGVALDSLSRFDEAIAAQQQSLRLRREIGDTHGTAVCLLNLGVVLQQRGDLECAADNFRQAMAAFDGLGDRLGQAHAQTNLGNVLNLTDSHDAALEHHTQALRSYRHLGSRIGEAFAHNGIGVALAALGEHTEAIDQYARALEITGEIDDTGLRAELFNRLGRAYHQVGDRAAARAAFDEALVLARTHGDRLEEANALAGLGQIAHASGHPAQATRHWTAALAHYDALGVPEADHLRARLNG